MPSEGIMPGTYGTRFVEEGSGGGGTSNTLDSVRMSRASSGLRGSENGRRRKSESQGTGVSGGVGGGPNLASMTGGVGGIGSDTPQADRVATATSTNGNRWGFSVAHPLSG